MPAIRYDFSASGYKAVEDAFKSIEQRANASARAAHAWGKTQEKSARTAGTAQKAAAVQYGPTRQTMYRAQVKAAADMAKAHGKAVAQHERAEIASQRKIGRARELEARQEMRRQAHYVKQLERQRHAAERVASAHRRRAMLEGAMGGAVRWGVRGALAVGAGGAGVAGMALRQGLELQEMAASLAVRARMAGKQALDPSVLRKEFEAAAAGAPGVKATEVAAGVQQIVSRTGEIALARSWEGIMATIISATDVSGQALGDTMATLMQKFDIKTVDGMRQAMADLTFQGKKGAFELTDMAQFMGEVGAAAERFGGLRGAQGVRAVGGMMQIARQSTGSGAEAATAVETMFRQMISASKEIKTKTGVEVFTDVAHTKTQPFVDLLPKIIAGAKGDIVKLQSIFDVRGIRAVSPLIAQFNELRASGSSVDEAMAGVKRMMLEAMDAGTNWAEMQRDAALRSETPQARLRAAWELTAATLTGSLLPAASMLAADFARWLSRDDVQVGLGKLADAAVGASDTLGIVFGWILDKMLAMGIVTPEDVAVRKAGRARERARGELAGMAPTAEETVALEQVTKTYGTEAGIAPAVLARIAETQGIRPGLAAQYFKTQAIMAATHEILFAGVPGAPEAAAPTGKIPGAMTIAGGILGGLPGMLLGGRAGEQIEKMGAERAPGVKEAAQQKAIDISRAVERLDALTAAADRAAGAVGKLGPRPDLYGGIPPS